MEIVERGVLGVLAVDPEYLLTTCCSRAVDGESIASATRRFYEPKTREGDIEMSHCL